METRRSGGSVVGILGLTLAWMAGCVDEQIVFRDLFDEPLAAAGSFLGYLDVDTKRTTCGSCHVGVQADWVETAHAGAWEGLQDSGHAQAFCEGCHTVSELGNAATGAAGFVATREERYEDVQCESCHGPGLAHVRDPADETVPLAPIGVGLDGGEGCGACHSGAHHPFVDEWLLSRHGEGANAPQYRTRTSGGCNSCHGAEGALQAWGVRTEYVEKGSGASLGITCAVCHDPHAGEHGGQLRFSVEAREPEQNLCMKCHLKRAIPDQGSSSSGPHSPQGPLLLGEVGEVGWTPPNFAYNVARIRGTHGSERNTKLCATCHVNAYEVDDPAAGGETLTSKGHLFKAIPCLDEDGLPTADDSCALSTEARSFAGCTASGCHGDADAALAALVVAEGRIAPLVAELNGLLAQVPSSQFSATDTIFTVAEGARFNAQLGAIPSSAVHNPFMTEALLTSSIAAVRNAYSLPALTGVGLENVMRELSLRGR